MALLKFRGASLNLNWKVNAVSPSWEAGGSCPSTYATVSGGGPPTVVVGNALPSGRPSAVHIAPVSSQLPVGPSAIEMSPAPFGVTVTSQWRLM